MPALPCPPKVHFVPYHQVTIGWLVRKKMSQSLLISIQNRVNCSTRLQNPYLTHLNLTHLNLT